MAASSLDSGTALSTHLCLSKLSHPGCGCMWPLGSLPRGPEAALLLNRGWESNLSFAILAGLTSSRRVTSLPKKQASTSSSSQHRPEQAGNRKLAFQGGRGPAQHPERTLPDMRSRRAALLLALLATLTPAGRGKRLPAPCPLGLQGAAGGYRSLTRRVNS